MRGHIFRLQAAGIHQGLHISVVDGDLFQLAVAKAVAARIAHMAHAKRGAVKHQRGTGGTHALGFGALSHGIRDGCVGIIGSCAQQGKHVIVTWVAVQALHGGDQQLGGNFPGGVATHAVGKHQKIPAGEGGIFVVSTNKTAVRSRGVVQFQ